MSRSLYAAAIVTVALLGLFHLGCLLASIAPFGWLPMLAGLLLGVLAADLASGLVHWACDTWGEERTPRLGGILRAFREHHRNPRAMLEHDWIEANGETATPSAICLLGMTLPACQAFLEPHPLLYGFLWSISVFGAHSNLAHRWAHTPSPPRWVVRLQQVGLILPAEHHALHHGVPTRAYCTLTGWSNAALDTLGVWRALERCVSALSGAQPRGYESEARSSRR